MPSQGINLNQWLSDNEVLVCIRDKDFNVRFQNPTCAQVCGLNQGVCQTQYCKGISPVSTSKLTKNSHFGEIILDMTVLPFEQDVLTLGVPHASKYYKIMQLFRDKKLSDREIEVGMEMAKGLCNREIMQKLSISHATLKTHINHIYRKLGDEKGILAR